jgi:hypothetical protein
MWLRLWDPKRVGRAVCSKTSQAGMTMAYEVGPRGQLLFGGATSADAPPTRHAPPHFVLE